MWRGGYLFKLNGRFDFGDMLGDVSLERRDVNRLSHSAGHFEVCKAVGEESGCEKGKHAEEGCSCMTVAKHCRRRDLPRPRLVHACGRLCGDELR
jgi:hypothetical protein